MDNLTCEQCAELLSARLDDMISQEEGKALEAHLAQCPECRQLARDLEQLHNTFTEIQVEAQIPAGLVQRVMARIARARRCRPVFRTLAGLAACMVICVGLYGVTQTRQLPEQPVAQAAVSIYSDAAPAGGEAASQSIAPRAAAAPEAAPAQENTQADMAAQGPSLLLILDAMPEGACELLPPETAVAHSTEDGSDTYAPLTREQLDSVAVLAENQGISADWISQDRVEGLCALVILSP